MKFSNGTTVATVDVAGAAAYDVQVLSGSIAHRAPLALGSVGEGKFILFTPSIGRELAAKIRRVAAGSCASATVDIGGGPGFLIRPSKGYVVITDVTRQEIAIDPALTEEVADAIEVGCDEAESRGLRGNEFEVAV